jgi:hypothetical protein
VIGNSSRELRLVEVMASSAPYSGMISRESDNRAVRTHYINTFVVVDVEIVAPECKGGRVIGAKEQFLAKNLDLHTW